MLYDIYIRTYIPLGDRVERIILHSDLNNFYASVECLYRTELRGKPVAVAGDIEKRHGIILAKNEEAKSFGIKTGETLWQAREKCPSIIFVPPTYERYLQYSRMVKQIYADYTDQVESFGLDECWLDVTGSTQLFQGGKEIADEIRKRVREELGVTVSIGVSYNKIFAKLGSDMKKPDGTTIITKDNYKAKVWPLPAENLMYVGKATNQKLKKYNIKTIGDLAQTSSHVLKKELGVNGVLLWQFANGFDRSSVAYLHDSSPIKSIGNSTTLPYDVMREEDIKIMFYILAESISERMRDQGLQCSTVQIGLRDRNLYSYERQASLTFPTNSADELFHKSFSLYKNNRPSFPLRSMSMRACNLTNMRYRQLSCLKEFQKMEKKERAEKAIDRIRQRFGHFSVERAVMLSNRMLSNLDPKTDHVIYPTGYLKKEGRENSWNAEKFL